MSDGTAENLTDLLRVEIFHLSQDENLTLTVRQAFEAATNRLAHLARRHQPIKILGRLAPAAILVEARVECIVDRLVERLAAQRTPALLGLMAKDSE